MVQFCDVATRQRASATRTLLIQQEESFREGANSQSENQQQTFLISTKTSLYVATRFKIPQTLMISRASRLLEPNLVLLPQSISRAIQYISRYILRPISIELPQFLERFFVFLIELREIQILLYIDEKLRRTIIDLYIFRPLFFFLYALAIFTHSQGSHQRAFLYPQIFPSEAVVSCLETGTTDQEQFC